MSDAIEFARAISPESMRPSSLTSRILKDSLMMLFSSFGESSTALVEAKASVMAEIFFRIFNSDRESNCFP